MPQKSVYLHKSVDDQVEFLAELLELSRSETIEDIIRHVLDNDMEKDVWEGYEEALDEFESAIEESGDEESTDEE